MPTTLSENHGNDAQSLHENTALPRHAPDAISDLLSKYERLINGYERHTESTNALIDMLEADNKRLSEENAQLRAEMARKEGI